MPLAPAPGQPVRYDYEYRHQGVCNLFLIAAPQQGWRTVKVTARRTKLDFAAVLRDLVDVHFPQAEKVVLVCDNLNTHHPSVLYEAFAPAEARRIAARLEWHYTPKHGSWLNRAASEFAALAAQCLHPGRIASRDRGLGAGPQHLGRARELAVDDRGRPHQAPAPVPYL